MQFIKLISLFLLVFFSQNALAWKININCNDGVVGSGVWGIADKGFDDAAGDTLFSSFPAIEGNGACETHINKGSDGWGTWGGRKLFPGVGKGGEVWVRIHIYLPVGFDKTARPYLKFFRIHTTGPGNVNEGHLDWLIEPDDNIDWTPARGNFQVPYVVVRETASDIRYIGDIATDRPVPGVWETYELYAKLDDVPVSAGGTALVRVWKNGKLLAEITDLQTIMNPNSFADAFLLSTYWNGGDATGTGAYPTKTQTMYFDDLVIQSERPASTDAAGNPMIGLGSNSLRGQPNPPQLLNIY